MDPSAPFQPRPSELRGSVGPGRICLAQLRIQALGRAERVVVGPELAVQPEPAVLVSGHRPEVVGELVPGLEVLSLAGVDLPKLPVPLIQVALELLLAARVACLPVTPGPHVGHRLGQVQVAERGLDVLPLLSRGQLGPDRQRLGRVAEQPRHRVRRVLLGEKLIDPRAVERPGAPVVVLGWGRVVRNSGEPGPRHPFKLLAGRHVIQRERPQPFPACPHPHPPACGPQRAAGGSAAAGVGGHRHPGRAADVGDAHCHAPALGACRALPSRACLTAHSRA